MAEGSRENEKNEKEGKGVGEGGEWNESGSSNFELKDI